MENDDFYSSMKYAYIGMALVKPNGEFYKVNNSLCEMLGYSEDELISMNFQTITHPEDLNQDLEYLYEMLQGKLKTYQMEKRYYHKNGEPIWIMLSVSLVWNKDGSPKYFISQIQDITKNKINENQKEELLEKLTESNQELENFAFAASHDMKEPIRTISTFTNFLKKKNYEHLNDKSKSYLDKILTATSQMDDLIEDLLDFAKVTHNSQSFEDVDTSKVVKVVLNNLYNYIEQSKAVVTYNDLPIIRGNPVKISRLVQNLISNAMKYQPEGQIPQIEISAKQKNECWEFFFSDNGIGMKPESCGEIFQPFRRLNHRKEYEGSGIGLSLCKKVIESLGGKIWAQSEIGKGSKFFFSIPTKKAS